MLLAIGYAAAVATNPNLEHWSIKLLLGLLIVAGIGAIVTGIIWAVQSYRNRHRENREAKVVRDYEALRESFKALYIKEGKSPEEAQKLAEFAAADSPPAPPIEGEEEWMSPREAYKNHIKKRNR